MATAKYTVSENNTFDILIEVPRLYCRNFERAMLPLNNLPWIKLQDDKYVVPFHSIRLVTKVLKSLGLDVDVSNLKSVFDKPDFNDLGQLFLRDEQYLFMKQVFKYFNGVLQLPTGYGKNVMMVYYIMASLHRLGNIIIFAPTYSLVAETQDRCAKYNVEINSEYNLESKVWIVNPIGLLNSSRIDNPDILEWLSRVTTIIIDESDAIPMSTSTLIDKYLPKSLYRIGMSATADKLTGLDLTSFKNLNQISEDTLQVLLYLGPAIVYKEPSRKIRIVTTPLYCGDYGNFYSYDKCVNQVTHSRVFVPYVKTCIKDNNRRKKATILLPFANRRHVSHLLTDVRLQEFRIAMWTANEIVFNDGTVNKNPELNYIKDLVNTQQLDMLMCSSVGFKGVDIVGLKSVMFISSSSFGQTTQILGRIFRYQGDELPTVYILENLSWNPLFNAARKKRFEYLRRNDHQLETLITGLF